MPSIVVVVVLPCVPQTAIDRPRCMIAARARPPSALDTAQEGIGNAYAVAARLGGVSGADVVATAKSAFVDAFHAGLYVGAAVALLDDQLNPVPSGTEGEVAVRVRPHRPLGLFQEYWLNPQEAALKFRGDWYLTGDRARCDADGYFWFIGRADQSGDEEKRDADYPSHGCKGYFTARQATSISTRRSGRRQAMSFSFWRFSTPIASQRPAVTGSRAPRLSKRIRSSDTP